MPHMRHCLISHDRLRIFVATILAAMTFATANAQEVEMETVKVGDQAVNFTVATDDEKVVELNDYLRQHKLVALVFVRAHW